MKAAGFGFECLTALSCRLLVVDCLCFMDDADVLEAAKSLLQRGEDIFHSVQSAMSLWAGCIRATGGTLNPPKCFWWLIDFKWNSSLGKWQFRRKRDFEWSGPQHKWQSSRSQDLRGALFTKDLDGSTVALRQLEPDEVEKTLGVMMGPNDDGSAQLTFLQNKALQWAEKVRSAHLQCYDVLLMVRTTIMKTLEYPMALTTFSQKQWREILSPVLMVSLPKAGVCRKFKRIMALSPLRFQGLGIPHPFVTQVSHHLDMLMTNLSIVTHVTDYLKAVLEAHRLKTGTSFELFQQVYANTAILTTNSWIVRVWRELDALGIHLELDTWDFEMLREGDHLIMDLFIEAQVPQDDLKWLNWCRIYLQVLTVSDIVTTDGTLITEDAWNGIRSSPRCSRYNWPRQERPAAQHWERWQAALQRVLSTNDSFGRRLRRPLGPWLDDLDDWNWVYSPSQSALFCRTCHFWTKANLPLDVQRASVFISKPSNQAATTYATITGIGLPSAAELPTHHVPSLIAAWQREAARIQGTYGWVPDDGSYSFNTKTGTASVWITTEDLRDSIWVDLHTPGVFKVQSPYQSELAGIFASVMVLSWLLQEWRHLSSDTPTVLHICDGQEALQQVFVYSKLKSSQPQFDLIAAARKLVAASGILWLTRHVHGHADKHRPWSELDWFERRNVEVDRRAGTFRERLEEAGDTQARNPRFFTEPCALFIDGSKSSWLMRDELENHILLPQLKKYWAKRKRLSPQAVDVVDWRVVEAAMKSLPAGMQRWCTKHITGMCAVGKHRVYRKLDEKNICPRCKTEEDHLHVPRCTGPTAEAEWLSWVTDFTAWLEINKTAPAVQASLLGFLAQIRDPTAMLHTDGASFCYSDQALVKARLNQSIIGSQGLLEGLLAEDWAPIQQAHFRSLGSRRSGSKWAAMVSKHLIQIGFYMWEDRNRVFHSDDSVPNQLLVEELDEEIRAQYALDPSDLPTPARRKFAVPLEQQLKSSLTHKKRWVQWMKLEREATERRLHVRCRLMYDFAHSGKVKKKIPRSRRVTKISNKTKQKQQKIFKQQSLLEWT